MITYPPRDQRKFNRGATTNSSPNIHILTEDLLAEILSRLPLRIILQLRCVCKSWSILSNNNPKLIHMKFNLMLLEGEKQLCSLDNDSLSSSLFDGIDGRVKKIRCPFLPLDSDLKDTNFVGSCNGLIYLCRAEKSFWGWKPCLWNPSTQELKYLPKPGFRVNETNCILNRGHGFGYDAKNDDYKCVRIFEFSSGFDSQLHIYSFRSNKWKLVYIPFLLATDHIDDYERAPNGVFCNGALHWFAGMRNSSTKVLFAFDIADEGTKIIPEPENLGVEKFGPRKHVDVLDGCLCMLYSNAAGFEVWLMKDYEIRESWTQAYNIPELTPILEGAAQTIVHLKKVECLKSGELLLEVQFELFERAALVLYDPKNERATCLKLYKDFGGYSNLRSVMFRYVKSFVKLNSDYYMSKIARESCTGVHGSNNNMSKLGK